VGSLGDQRPGASAQRPGTSAQCPEVSDQRPAAGVRLPWGRRAARLVLPDTRQVIKSTPEPNDPRDPLGLAADAPLLAAWLD